MGAGCVSLPELPVPRTPSPAAPAGAAGPALPATAGAAAPAPLRREREERDPDGGRPAGAAAAAAADEVAVAPEAEPATESAGCEPAATPPGCLRPLPGCATVDARECCSAVAEAATETGLGPAAALAAGTEAAAVPRCWAPPPPGTRPPELKALPSFKRPTGGLLTPASSAACATLPAAAEEPCKSTLLLPLTASSSASPVLPMLSVDSALARPPGAAAGALPAPWCSSNE
jgi:hypothetical protein